MARKNDSANVDVRKELKKIFDNMLEKIEKENPLRYSDIKHVVEKLKELL